MSGTDAHFVDVLDVSDLRFAGGTAHSIAEEVRAQHAAGFSTALIHLNGPLVAKVSPVNAQIRQEVQQGHAELLVRGERVRARAAVVRHPAVLEYAADQLPPIETDHVVIVANAAPHDIDGHEHYRPEQVHQIARQRFGREPLWAPIGPQVRQSIAGRVPPASLLESDWVNIIDVEAWEVERTGPRGHRPVVGRHSRASAQKWPRDVETLQAVYPVDGSWTVRVLGGAEPAEALLGKLPDSWEVYEFGAMSPKEFLAGLDFFVYYHDPRWVEAFGRTVLEALASGVPAILPPAFEPLFGAAAIYAEPPAVRRIVDRLYADRRAYEDQVARAADVARSRFGHQAHIARLAELIGTASDGPDAPGTAVTDEHAALTRPVEPPRLPEVALTVPAAAEDAGGPRAAEVERIPVLFISSNGSGMGHLTRLLAYAVRAEAGSRVEPHFLSLSQAAPVVSNFGYTYEYLPSMTATGLAPGRWHAYFAESVAQVMDRIRPAVVVFDGTWPYEGIPAVRETFPDARWLWSRRGMWKPGQGTDRLHKADWFDLVLEPGDLASPADRGVTGKTAAARVGPVTLLDTADLDERAEARAALGVDPDVQLALVSLGAGNINDTSGDVGASIAALRDLGVEVCVTKPEIAADGGEHTDVHVVRTYPLSRYYRAFDVAVSAAGYNSFHELLRFGVPTLFVPNRQTALDDQEARARFAAESGLAHQLPSVTVQTAEPMLADLLAHGPEMIERVKEIDPGNGAAEAATYIANLIR
ncbi:glycosyltransferase [Phytoactinopolyspora endophytica]|uniref:glycosyltransferase n=1 Tax=Phytoactinopolyspora endophytica TaxID=1642495 RepID=UPI00197BA5D4|nr:glycosyltransferase [Phytoactinopolyspora endophytica]